VNASEFSTPGSFVVFQYGLGSIPDRHQPAFDKWRRL